MANKLSAWTLRLALVIAVLAIAGIAWLTHRGGGAGTDRRPADLAGSSPPAELIASIRSEPRSFNRLVARDRTSSLVALLVHSPLVRVNLETQEVEPALAERWSASSDGTEYTLTLRRDVRFSDGSPFTSTDVLFTFGALYDEAVGSVLADAVSADGRPLSVSAADEHTVVIRFPVSYGPGVRVLNSLPILPKHRLEPAFLAGRFRDAWTVTTAPSEMAGLGPFVLQEYRPGERLVFARNPHYWKTGPGTTALPRLDRLVLIVAPDQRAEMLRLEAGESDLMTSEVAPSDLAALRLLAAQARLVVADLGVGLDPDFFWFNLSPRTTSAGERAWMRRRELRQAISMSVNRDAFVDTVYLGAGVSVNGPVTPGNRLWFDRELPSSPYDPRGARELLGRIGLRDVDGDGRLEAPDGRTPARFSLLTQKGSAHRERAAQFLQEELRGVGLAVDVVALDQPAVIERITKGEYEAAYFGLNASDTDPAANLDFWRSSGAFHVWNPGQATPSTEWERRIDELMRRQVSAPDHAERKRLFDEVQRIFAAEQPAVYFAAPRIHVAMSPRVGDARPALLQPHVLWNADQLSMRLRAGSSP